MKAKHSPFYWLFWAAGLILVIGVLLCICRESYFSQCQGCLSSKESQRWRVDLAFGLALPLSREKISVSGSQFLKEMLGGIHSHHWIGGFYRSHYPLQLGGWMVSGNFPDASALLMAYEKNPAFRAYILRRINAGSISKADFTAAALLSSYVAPGLGENPEERRLRALSKEWLEAFKQPGAEPR